MDNGVEAIADAALERALQRQARRVYVESIVAGMLLTGIVILLPG